ncbi:hypothetical protein Q8F55_006086 [Vanrija albida]|uniref:BTB domain-containing protein n=1 Tax=Vanrija albida TaxID=181172 RepID=A0ABR3Q3C6_9TREE
MSTLPLASAELRDASSRMPRPTRFVSCDGVVFTFDLALLAHISPYFATLRPPVDTSTRPAVVFVISVEGSTLRLVSHLLRGLGDAIPPPLPWPTARVLLGLVHLITHYRLPALGRALLARTTEPCKRRHALEWLLVAAATGADLREPVRATIRYGLNVHGLDRLVASAPPGIVARIAEFPDAVELLTEAHADWEVRLRLFSKNLMYNVYQLDCAQCGFSATADPQAGAGYVHFGHLGESMRPSHRLDMMDLVMTRVWRFLRESHAPWDARVVEAWASAWCTEDALSTLLVQHVSGLTACLRP